MKKMLALVAIIGVFAGMNVFAADKNSLRINGSTTVLPIAQKAAEDFMKGNPDINISVRGTGSGDGIKALIDGTTDIANSSRAMKKEEKEKASAKGITAVEHVVALDALSIIVHPSNKISDLTLEQIKDIYTGKVKNWKEVGGEDKEIVVISRDSSSGTYEFFVEHVLKKEKPLPEALLQSSSGAVAQVIAKNKYAIGYVGIGYLNKDLKAVTVNGVVSSVSTVHDGSYPVWRGLYMYTNGNPEGKVKAFIDFLKSEEGQKIVEEEGFVPLK